MQLSTIFFRFKKYVHYWLDRVDEHSLHSPFIFGLYNQVLREKIDNTTQFDGIENLRKLLLKDDRVLNTMDLGAGSSVNSSHRRTVRDIAKHSLTHKKSALFFCRLIEYFDVKKILELGTSLGVNTLYLASNVQVEQVITIEGCGETAALAKKNFHGLFEDKIVLINSDIKNVFPEVLYHTNQLDFILIDANHTHDATIAYYQACKQFVHEDTVIIIDDIYWSEGMSKAWVEIKRDIVVTLSIDLFDMGIIFFKKTLQKEHYVLNW